MSAVSRLWRRAPAWRFFLFAAIAFSGLAAMFPPYWLTIPIGKTTMAAPHFAMPQVAKPADGGRLEMPADGASRSGVIPFSGRTLPLPAGNWQDLVIAQGSGAAAVQIELLARIENQHLTGLEMAAAPSPVGNSIGSFDGYGPCNATNAIAHETLPVPGADPLARECWAFSEVDMAGDEARIKTDQVIRHGLEKLQHMGVQVPDRMLTLDYLRADETGWMTVFLFLPGRHEEPRHKLLAWVRRFAPLLHKGYISSLKPADLASVARDPA